MLGKHLAVFGRAIAYFMGEAYPIEKLKPLLECPPIGFAVASSLLSNSNHKQIVDSVIPKESSQNKRKLIEALAGELADFQQKIDLQKPDPLATKQDCPLWDALLAEQIEKLGATAEAKVIYETSQGAPLSKLWDLWLPGTHDEPVKGISILGPVKGIAILAEMLWKYRVEPQIEKERGKPVAVTTLIHDEVLTLLTQNFKRKEEKGGQRLIVFPEDSILSIVTTIGSDALDALMVQKGVDLFGSIPSHKVFRWQMFTGHKQALEGNPDPRLLRVDGGIEYFCCEVLGMSKAQAKMVEQIIEAQHATSLLLPGHSKPSRLLIREYIKQRGRARAQINMILGTTMLPDYVDELKTLAKGRIDLRRWKRLVPVCDIPPLIGRQNEAGGQATLSMLTVGDFRDHAAELVEDGGTDLLNRIESLAVKAGVLLHILPALIDRWENDGPDGPAFLHRKGRLHTLGDAHKTQRDFIEEGGRKELQGSKAGKKGKANRERVLERKGK
jgi:hypothetical protein